MLILGLQPEIFAALAAAHRITDSDIGILTMAEIASLAVGSILGVRLFQATSMARTALKLATLLAALDLACCQVMPPLALCFIRGLAGLLEGGLLGATIVIITHSAAPERLNGAFLAVQTAPQAVGTYLLPVWAVPRWGASSGFVALAAFAVLAACSAWLLPSSKPVFRDLHAKSAPFRPTVFAAVAAILLQYAGIGAAWNFGAQLGAELGLKGGTVGTALSGCLVVQVVSAALVGLYLWRLEPLKTILVGLLILFGISLSLPFASGSVAFVALFWAFGGILLGLGPYQVGLLIRLDPTRRAATLITPLTLAGWSIGPLVSSVGVRAGHSGGAFSYAAGFSRYPRCFILPAAWASLPKNKSRERCARGIWRFGPHYVFQFDSLTHRATFMISRFGVYST